MQPSSQQLPRCYLDVTSMLPLLPRWYIIVSLEIGKIRHFAGPIEIGKMFFFDCRCLSCGSFHFLQRKDKLEINCSYK